MNLLEKTLTSLEVAEMVGRRHDQVLRDIRTIISHLGNDHKNVEVEKYFIQSDYEDKKGETRECYLLTKKGCELYSTRMTGEKGTKFAVAYIERFNQMESHIKKEIDTTQLSPELQMFKQIFDSVAKTQIKQQEQDKRLDDVEKKQDDIKEVLSLNPVDWKKKANNIINKIAKERGGFEAYADVRRESYELLEARAKCRLSIRLTNMKSEMALNGVAPSKVKRKNKLDVIGEDARLLEIYLAIIKEMAIKYGVDAS